MKKSIIARYGLQTEYERLRFPKTREGKLEKIKRDGPLYDYAFIRRRTLNALGFKVKEGSENLIITGCSIPFGFPLRLMTFIRLLDRLGLDYNFIMDKEYCCNIAAVQCAEGEEELERAFADSKECVGLNVAQAKELRARRMIHLCYNCLALYQRSFGGGDIAQMYLLDVVLEPLERERLRLQPTVVGYYEGCWRRGREMNPGLDIKLAAYRQLAGRIEGLEIVDLNHNICCTTEAGTGRIAEQAISYGVSAICSAPRSQHRGFGI